MEVLIVLFHLGLEHSQLGLRSIFPDQSDDRQYVHLDHSPNQSRDLKLRLDLGMIGKDIPNLIHVVLSSVCRCSEEVKDLHTLVCFHVAKRFFGYRNQTSAELPSAREVGVRVRRQWLWLFVGVGDGSELVKEEVFAFEISTVYDGRGWKFLLFERNRRRCGLR